MIQVCVGDEYGRRSARSLEVGEVRQALGGAPSHADPAVHDPPPVIDFEKSRAGANRFRPAEENKFQASRASKRSRFGSRWRRHQESRSLSKALGKAKKALQPRAT